MQRTLCVEKDQSTLLSTAGAPYFDEKFHVCEMHVYLSPWSFGYMFFCWCCVWCGRSRACNVSGAGCCKRAGKVPYVRSINRHALSFSVIDVSFSVMRRISRRFSCQTHVIHMSHTCHTYTCRTHVIHMSNTCQTHVAHMTNTCHTPAKHMSNTCQIQVKHMSHTWHTHAKHMSY